LDAIGLIPDFGNLAFTVLAFLAALSIIVAVHEYGHYLVGRWSGIHAEVFSLGFGPVIFSRVDRRGTRWQIAAVPLGGYVRFLGDGDAASASQDEGFLEHLVKAEREKELRRSMFGAPLWARSATVAAGPVFNFILAALVFAGVFFSQGKAIEPPTVGELVALPAGHTGLERGDTILAVEGFETPDYSSFYDALDKTDVTAGVTYTVRRDGAVTEVEGVWPYPAIVEIVQPGSAAMDAGVRGGDVILSIDGEPIVAFKQLQEIVLASDGRELVLEIWREGETIDIGLAPRRTDLPLPDGGFETRWLLGLAGGFLFVPATEPIGPIEALGNGTRQVWTVATSSLSALYHMVTGAISACNLRGPIGIAETSGEVASQGLAEFIWFIAVLSTAIGLMNLFPIPVLDGGHLVFHAWEATTGRPPSEKVLRYLMGGGLALILTLMVFALSNDLFCP
jgi:regulator of sigma E protease